MHISRHPLCRASYPQLLYRPLVPAKHRHVEGSRYHYSIFFLCPARVREEMHGSDRQICLVEGSRHIEHEMDDRHNV